MPAQSQGLLLNPSPSSRTQAYLLASIPPAYLRSQFIEDSHNPARPPFRSAQHVSEVSPRTPASLPRARVRLTNQIGISSRSYHMLREALDFGLTLVPTPDITIPTNFLSRHPRPLRHRSLGPSDLVSNLCPWFSELSIRLNVAIRLALHLLYFLLFLSFSLSTL